MSESHEEYPKDGNESRNARYERNSRDGRDGRDGYIPKSIQEALIIAALIACVGAWWTFGKSIAVLQAMQDSQQRQLDKLDRRQDTLEGRLTRGEPDAPDQQR